MELLTVIAIALPVYLVASHFGAEKGVEWERKRQADMRETDKDSMG